MTTSQLRLGMIGCGRHASAELHPLFRRLSGACVVAMCDRDEAAAKRAAGHHGIQATYTDWRAMHAQEDLDGVIVCINDRSHAELAPDLLRAGLHVLVEKPHAPTPEASLAMVSAARESSRVAMAAYKKRYTPAYLHAYQAMRRADFGDPCYLSCYRAMGGNNQTTPGYLWQWGCHVIDAVHWLMGPVTEVQAWRNASDWRAVTINLLFHSGAVGNLTLCSPGGNWERTTVLGRGGQAVIVENGLTCIHHDGNAPIGGYVPSATAGIDGAAICGFLGELQAFVDAIHSGQEPDASLARVHHAVEIHAAILESLATNGKSVVIPASETLAGSGV
jgi:predicted dehydrogenase